MIENKTKQYLQEHGFENLNLKAVLFDMDGVLFDSMPTHAHAWKETSDHYNLGLSESEAYENEGRTAKSTLNILFQRNEGRDVTEEEVKEIYAYKIKVYNKYNVETVPMKGAAELLSKIRKDGFQIILVTGSGQDTLMDRLEKFYPGIFTKDVMITAKNVKRGKPDPEPYLQGLKCANVHPWEAIVIENAPLGVRSAVRAGIFTVAVNTGPIDDEKLLGEGANLLYHSMQELSDNWEELRKNIQ